MKFTFKKLRSALINTKSTENVVAATYTGAIIKDVEGVPFAIAETNVLYAGLSELAGYHYFKTITVGTMQLKTFKGAKLIIRGTDFSLDLRSDMEELESESTTGSDRRLTRIDFELDKEDLPKISKERMESIELVAKKNHILFSHIEGGYDEGLSTEGLTEASTE
ncbi:hypothetical protein ES711_15790 [Gelidibacter salicanalis]|uniref:Uncharacterized protein n=1 Tax=Gelidibacter salicanalis TaxID=291193 RepID=A0A5C7AG60_9FLAO|nr:hypothetical protein [Gelidibacter salicanalis]TXE05525.1 hypothetical protein ES711_15790 [Gelidibacter salicanalis]